MLARVICIALGLMIVVVPSSFAATFTPTDDTYVQSGAPTTSFGTSTSLRTDPSSSTYLKFSVSGLTAAVTSAKLRLFVTNGSQDGPMVSSAATGWLESSLTWNTQPAGATPVLADLGVAAINTWVEVDVSSHVRGNGTYALKMYQSGLDGFTASSRTGTKPPQLVVTTATTAPTTPVNPTPTTPSVPSTDATARPFGPNAAWNRTIKDVTNSGTIFHPDSALYVDRFWNSVGFSPGDLNMHNHVYSFPIYYASDANQMLTVKSTTYIGNMEGLKMPWNSGWVSSGGTDGQVIVLDPATGREWNLWMVRVSGGIIYAGAANLVDGDYRTKEDGYSRSRGVGIQYSAMTVRPYEVRAGVINHALAMSVRNPSGTECYAPATKIERPDNPAGVPEGMRYRLNVTDAEINAWKATLPASVQRSAGIVAVAMRDYGWFITDTSGSSNIEFEDVSGTGTPGDGKTAGQEWSELGLNTTTEIMLNGKKYPQDFMDGLISPSRIQALNSSNTYAPGANGGLTPKVAKCK